MDQGRAIQHIDWLIRSLRGSNLNPWAVAPLLGMILDEPPPTEGRRKTYNWTLTHPTFASAELRWMPFADRGFLLTTLRGTIPFKVLREELPVLRGLRCNPLIVSPSIGSGLPPWLSGWQFKIDHQKINISAAGKDSMDVDGVNISAPDLPKG